MKKRIIALFCAMLVVTCLSGCSTTETIHNETKFEIVDISTCMKITLQGPNEFYIVTYRTLSK